MFMIGATVFVAVSVGTAYGYERDACRDDWSYYNFCNMSAGNQFAKISGGFGGFNQSLTAATLPPDKLENEFISFCM